ncbi:MAG: hypothetical protein KC561_12675, partial [Myxococcales bacterium]|nr:hypothetical protein [Myxococcales bacterium]
TMQLVIWQFPAIVLTVLCGVSLQAATSHAQPDYAEYARLSERANELLEALRRAGDDERPALREQVIEADILLCSWLDDFFVTEEFNQLSETTQQNAFMDRYVCEYNLSRQLIAVRRCEQSARRIRQLLDSEVDAPQVRDELLQAYEESITCVASTSEAPESAIVIVDVVPDDARIVIDGTELGRPGQPIELPPGPHVMTLSASGSQSQTLSFSLPEGGQERRLGPIILDEISSGKSARWYEWTLWGTGTAGLTAGIVVFLQARDREDQLDNPPPGLGVVGETEERERVERLDMVAYIVGGVGIAAVLAGTLSYVLRGSPPDQDTSVSWSVSPGPDRFDLRVLLSF